MAIMSLHWMWRLFWSERRSAVRSERHVPPLVKVEVERLPDYRWRDLGFSQVRHRDETDRTR